MEVWLNELEALRDADAHRRELLPHQKHLALGRSPPQSVNTKQHLGKYLLAFCYLGPLKRDDPAMPNCLRSYLDPFGQ